MKKTDKKGSVTVFIMLFFVTLVMMILAFVSASKNTAVRGATDALGSLWGKSILAEYDLNLKNRYGLLGFKGGADEVKRKLDFYIKKSFHGKKYIKYGDVKVFIINHSLLNLTVFKKQVLENGKLALAEKLIKPRKIAGGETGDSFSVIRNNRIISGLPSQKSKTVMKDAFSLSSINRNNSIKKIIRKGGDKYIENQYIFAFFKNRLNHGNLGKTLFNEEIEYIISGKNSDTRNQNGVRSRIITVRTALNMLYLEKTPKMRRAALAAAELITPGPAAVGTQQLILGTWAYVESRNDYKLLLKGHNVKFFKNNATWAIDLSSVISNTESGCIYTGVDEGDSYEDYLKVFLIAMNEDKKLLRMMDIIQLNMRYMYYRDFSMEDFFAGLRYTVKVNGKEHEFEEAYEER